MDQNQQPSIVEPHFLDITGRSDSSTEFQLPSDLNHLVVIDGPSPTVHQQQHDEPPAHYEHSPKKKNEAMPASFRMALQDSELQGRVSRILYSPLDTKELRRKSLVKGLPPMDLLLIIDNSGSIGMSNFRQCKDFVCRLLNNVNVGLGKSRVACVTFSTDAELYFSFERYFSVDSIKGAIQRIPFKGGSTCVGRALEYGTNVLTTEKSSYRNSVPFIHHLKKFPKIQAQVKPNKGTSTLGLRLQTVLVVTDGFSEDHIESGAIGMHQKLGARIAAVGIRPSAKEMLTKITGYDGAAFLLTEYEDVANWLLRQQARWLEVNGYDPAVYGTSTTGPVIG